jgi:hypothetical protein
MRAVVLALLCGALTACAAVPQIANVLFGTDAVEKYPPGELYKYRGELTITVDGKAFEGVAVTKQGPVNIRIDSKFGLDRIQFTSCGRHDVKRDLESSWFSKTKNFTYAYTPNEMESQGLCPLYIEAFNKQALAAWGFVAFRKDETLTARVGCNGVEWKFAGYSVCQTKAGLDQSVSFEQDIEDYEADPLCNMKKTSARTFTVRPGLGMCAATFYSKGLWHTMNLLGYERVLVQGD